MTRLVSIFVVLAVVLAGCAGFSPSVPDSGDADASGNGNGVSGSGNGGSDGTSEETAKNSFEPFQFERPGKYTFEVMDANKGSGKLVWDVQSIDGENVTLDSVFEFEGERQTSSMTVNRENAVAELAFSPGGQYAIQTMYSGAMSHAYGKDLKVGQSWSFTTADGSMKFEITEKRTYAGIECYYSELRLNGSVARDGCYSPDHGVAPYSAYYDETGKTLLEVKLVKYKSK